MGQEEWASLQHALQLLVTQFLRDEVSVFVLLNFVTSMYALGAFCTKVRRFFVSENPLTAALASLTCMQEAYVTGVYGASSRLKAQSITNNDCIDCSSRGRLNVREDCSICEVVP